MFLNIYLDFLSKDIISSPCIYEQSYQTFLFSLDMTLFLKFNFLEPASFFLYSYSYDIHGVFCNVIQVSCWHLLPDISDLAISVDYYFLAFWLRSKWGICAKRLRCTKSWLSSRVPSLQVVPDPSSTKGKNWVYCPVPEVSYLGDPDNFYTYLCRKLASCVAPHIKIWSSVSFDLVVSQKK